MNFLIYIYRNHIISRKYPEANVDRVFSDSESITGF